MVRDVAGHRDCCPHGQIIADQNFENHLTCLIYYLPLSGEWLFLMNHIVSRLSTQGIAVEAIPGQLNVFYVSPGHFHTCLPVSMHGGSQIPALIDKGWR